jgi:hypothetical protein
MLPAANVLGRFPVGCVLALKWQGLHSLHRHTSVHESYAKPYMMSEGNFQKYPHPCSLHIYPNFSFPYTLSAPFLDMSQIYKKNVTNTLFNHLNNLMK